MSRLSLFMVGIFCFVCLIFITTFPVAADVQSDVTILEKRLNDQDKLISAQQAVLAEQSKQLAEQKKQLEALLKKSELAEQIKKAKLITTKKLSQIFTSNEHPGNKNTASAQKASLTVTQQTHSNSQKGASGVQSMTPPEAPQSATEQQRPQVQALANQGGVLTPKGVMTFENAIEYTNTTRNLFIFNGVEIATTVLAGAITDTAARHEVVQESGRFRLGLTDRLEADIHIPYVYRNDALTNMATQNAAVSKSSVEGHSIGDIDAGLAYQLNNGNEDWPFLIGNFRYKANNADGPYDVPYNSNNIATRLPTGTGFQTFEASVTAIKVSDPAVLFGNLGYVYDMSRNINKDIGSLHIGRVDPGDAINALFGVSFAINQETSFSLGYKHSYVFSTIQNASDITSGATSRTSSGSSQVGSLTFGLAYALTPTQSINVNVEHGVTNDAPDLHLMVRMPFQLGKIF